MLAGAAIFLPLLAMVEAPPPPGELRATAVIIGDPVEYSLSLKREGKLREARAVLEKALEADPQNWRAHHVLGWICLDLKDKQAALEHLRRAVYLGPPCSEEVNLDARTVSRLLSGKGELASFASLGPSAREEFLRMMAPAIFLYSLGEQAGLGEREKGLLFGLGMLFGKVAKRLKPFEEELNRHGLALLSAYQAGDWGTLASELQAVSEIFARAARGAEGTEEGRLLIAVARGIKRAAPYVAQQDWKGATQVLEREIKPVLERIFSRMMRQARAMSRAAREEMAAWRRHLEEWANFQQILNLPPVSPMTTYSPVGVRIRE